MISTALLDRNADEVIPELSELHRKAVCELDDFYGRGPRHLSRDLGISKRKAASILSDLRRHGVVDYGALFDEDDGRVMGRGYWLDTFGQRVKERLESGR